MAHLKRPAVPVTWPIKRKGLTFITKQYPRCKPEYCMPLSIIIRDALKLGTTTREIRRILRERQILVNGTIRTEQKFPVSILDIVEIPKIKKTYLVTFDGLGKIILQETKKPEFRILRIENKAKQKAGKTQLNLFDGTNVIVEKDEYKIGDALKLNYPQNKIGGKISLAEGANVFVVGGAHIGETATIKSMHLDKGQKEVVLKGETGEFKTLIKNIHLIG